MMEETFTLESLFQQLGLGSSDSEIRAFIKQHRIPDGVRMFDAEFWSEGQSQFIREELSKDSDWANVIDNLNVALRD